MTEAQLRNIIGFTFCFHIQHMNFVNQSPDYIKEKWDKFMGVNTHSNFIEPRHYYLKQLLKRKAIRDWIEKWKVSEETFLEMKEIVHLICVLNTKPIDDQLEVIDPWTLSGIIDEYKKIIHIEEVNNSPTWGAYTHDVVKLWIERFLGLPENKREYKLNLLL